MDSHQMVFYIKSGCGGRPQYLTAPKPRAGKSLGLSETRDTPWVWSKGKELLLFYDQTLSLSG